MHDNSVYLPYNKICLIIYEINIKKKLPINSNTTFAQIEDIIKVHAEIEARRAEFDKMDAAKLAREVTDEIMRTQIDGLLHKWHVTDDAELPTATATLNDK
jgi:hypothetical protein